MKKPSPAKFMIMGALALSVPAHAASTSAGNGPVDKNIFVELAKKVVPSVVNISTLTTVKGNAYSGSPQDDLFRKFFEDFFRNHGGMPYGGGGMDGDEGDQGDQDAPPPPSQNGKPRKAPKAMALGTGFILEPGLILTNNHVVAGADEIKINFTEETDEKPTDGTVVGRDPEIDVALIRVNSKRDMKAVELGDSDALQVGEYVMAIGNPFGQGHSVTHGIISAKGRLSPDFPLATYLQTDAPINPGNSGGPLVNLKGEVIGINNAIHQGAQGIGFAIPISVVKKVLPQLKTKGTVARGYIGVLVNELTPDIASKIGAPKDLEAPFVTHVYPGEPADKAGIKPYDIILDFNGKPIKTSSDLITAVTNVSVGESVPIKVRRGDKELPLTIKVSKRPGADQLPNAEKEKSKDKKKKAPARIDTGMTLEDISPEIARDLELPPKTAGAVVSSVDYGGPADRAGLLRGDVILEVDRKAIKGVDDFYSIVKDKKTYLLRVRRADPSGREAFSVIILDLKSES